MDTKRLARPTWVEIDLDSVTNNIRELKKIIGEKVTILGALKATGYGHGLVPMAKHILNQGINILQVGNIYEGIRLRENDISASIVVYGSSLPEAASLYKKYDLIPSFINPSDPEEYMKVLGPDVPLKVWIKVEIGLGRCGVFPNDLYGMIYNIHNKTPYKIEGIYSHIGSRANSSASKDVEYCEWQWGQFKEILDKLEDLGIKIPYLQVASSHSVLALPHTWLNCVSIGTALYLNPKTENSKFDLNFMESYKALRSKLISVKEFDSGSQIGGVELRRKSLIGVAPIGTGDGLPGKLAGQDVLIRGFRAKIIAGVSLEHIRIDVTDVPDASVGDIVTILGTQGKDAITFEEVARKTGISKFELYTSISQSSVPYVFLKNGVISDIEMTM